MRATVALLLAAAATTASAKKYKRVACLGDSITRGDTLHEFPNHEPAKEGRGNYPKTLRTLLPGKPETGNFGASGAGILSIKAGGKVSKRQYINYVAENQDNRYEAAIAFEPDAVVFMMGVNDGKTFDEFPLEQFLVDYRKALEAIVRDFKKIGPIFMVVPPIIVTDFGSDLFMEMVNYNSIPAVRRAYEENKKDFDQLELIDIDAEWQSRTTCVKERYDDQTAECGSYYRNPARDGVHMSEKGADLLAELIADAILDKEAASFDDQDDDDDDDVVDTLKPTKKPTQPETYMPSYQPTPVQATSRPTPRPRPTSEPTPSSTKRPTRRPTTAEPTTLPPTFKPSRRPTTTSEPTTLPPTFKPSRRPSTAEPTTLPPTFKPSRRPSTAEPTTLPPTFKPSRRPTTSQPTSPEPTAPLATNRPSWEPSYEPTYGPTEAATVRPTPAQPTSPRPSSSEPSYRPSERPTDPAETLQPTFKPVPPRPTAVETADCEAARCVMNGRKMAIVGDSNSRYHTFNINRYLETCAVGPFEYDKWGEEGDWGPPDTKEYWTRNWGRSISGSHKQGPLCTEFKDLDDAKTCYWFIQSTWNSRAPAYTALPDLVKEIQRDFDMVLFNSGWWDLKFWAADKATRGYESCGTKMDAGVEDKTCVDLYRDDMRDVVESLFDPFEAAVFRSSSCCGDFVDKKTETGEAIKIINKIAKDVVGADRYAEIFEDWSAASGPTSRDENTVDGAHPTAENLQKWTVAVMKNLDAQLGTRCFAAEPTARPSPRPSAKPSRQPSREPSYLPTDFPSQEPTSLEPTTAEPSSGEPSSPPPSGKPSSEPSSVKPSSEPSTRRPTLKPSAIPTYNPSSFPTVRPGEPTARPVATAEPSSRQPSPRPSAKPSRRPTAEPTAATTFVVGDLAFDGVDADDAAANAGVFKVAVARMVEVDADDVSVSVAAAARRRLQEAGALVVDGPGDVVARYAIETPKRDSARVAGAIESLTLAEVDEAVAAAAGAAGVADRFRTIATTFIGDPQTSDSSVLPTREPTVVSTPEPSSEPTASAPAAKPTPEPSSGGGGKKKSSSSSGLGAGTIVLIVVCVVVGVGIACCAAFAVVRATRGGSAKREFRAEPYRRKEDLESRSSFEQIESHPESAPESLRKIDEEGRPSTVTPDETPEASPEKRNSSIGISGYSVYSVNSAHRV